MTKAQSMHVGLIQGSLNSDSKTALVVEACADYLKKEGHSSLLVDLRDRELPFCDGRDMSGYNHEVAQLAQKLEQCTHFVLGMPVYQYTVSGPLKNFLDIFVETFKGKAFGIVEVSGSVRSYLAAKDLLSSLFFEVAAIPVPPVVHARDEDFSDKTITNTHIFDKIAELTKRLQTVPPL